MATVTLNSLQHRRQRERTRAAARHHEAFDHEMLRDFLVSLLAWCDVAGIPNFEDVLAEAEAQFTALVDPE